MHSNVNSFLGFDGGCIPSREWVVIGQAKDNGSFLLHQIMSAALKEHKSVLLASFIQKLHHYNAVSQKLGTSLKSATDAKQFLFFDGLEDFANKFCTEEPGSNPVLPKSLDLLKEKILKLLSDLREQSTKDAVLVIDDLSVLISMGFRVRDVCMFMKYIHEAVVGVDSLIPQENQPENGSSVVVLCSYDEEDRDSVNLWQFLVNLSTLDVNVTGLQTGYCKDVHGQARVTRQNNLDVPGQRAVTSKTRQFKLSDNNVEFFAAGTSTAVL
ncbi:hypothetical protein ACOMHN_037678 [Nucella lapillus]